MIILVSQYKFPEGDAGSVRFLYFAQQLQQLGYDVLVVGHGKVTTKIELYKGVKYLSLRTGTNRYKSILLFQYKLSNILKKISKKNSIDCIILGTSTIDIAFYIKSYCSKKRILLINDVVEFYSKKQFARWYFSFSYLTKMIHNIFFIDRSVRVISISRYLTNYFESKNIVTQRIPNFFNQNEYCISKRISAIGLSLLYAGSPGKKDNLGFVLKSLSLLSSKYLNKIVLTLVGINLEQVLLICADEKIDWEKIKDTLVVKGKLNREDVLEEYLQTDFSILIRDAEEIYAQAGFPTKVVESLSMSTPVICNLSSDLELYLEDMRNALIVKDKKYDSFNEIIIRAIALSIDEKKALCNMAKETAMKHFDIDSYRSEFVNILRK